MTQTLMWKEWRENRAIVLAGLAVVTGLPTLLIGFALASGAFVVDVLDELAPQLVVTLVWPLFAALFGASAFGSERNRDTIEFLTSRPVSRARVWVVKVAMAAIGLTAVIVASMVFVTLLGGGAAFSQRWTDGWAWSLVVVLLVFASSLLVSHRASQPLAAAAIGGVLAGVTYVATAATVGSLYFFFGSGGGVPSSFLTTLVALVAALLLIGSLIYFAGRELRAAIGVGDAATVFVGVFGVAVLVAEAPPRLTQASFGPSWSRVREVLISPDGSTMVFEGRSASRRQSQIWRARAVGGPLQRLSNRWRPAYAPMFSPDGERVVYFTSHGGPREQPWRAASLWVARPDGSDTRRLLGGLPATRRAGAKQMAFSPDGARIAVLQHRRLTVVEVDGGEVRTADLTDPIPGTRRADLLGWSSDGSEVYVAGVFEAERFVAAHDVQRGTSREITRFRPEGRFFWLTGTTPSLRPRPAPSSEGDFLLFFRQDAAYEQEVRERALEAIDGRSGQIHQLTDRACSRRSMAMADGAVFYFECPPAVAADETSGDQEPTEPGAVLLRWDPASGVTPIGSSPIPARDVIRDREGSRLAAVFGSVVLQNGSWNGRFAISVLSLDGTVLASTPDTPAVRSLGASGLVPHGFAPDDQLILGPRSRGRYLFRMLDVEQGSARLLQFTPNDWSQ